MEYLASKYNVKSEPCGKCVKVVCVSVVLSLQRERQCTKIGPKTEAGDL